MKTTNYFIFLLFFAVLSACQNKPEKPDLRGHWHVYNPDSTFSTWDIIDTTELIFNINNYESSYSQSYYITEDDTLFHRAQFNHLEGSYKYELSNDTLLYLKEVESIPINDSAYLEYTGKTIAYAVKVDSSTCDKAKEYYGNSMVNINLPASEKVVKRDEVLVNRVLVSYINIGNPKSFIHDFARDTFLLQIYVDAFIAYHSISEYIEQERSKLPEVQRDSLIIQMGIDRNTPAMVVDSIERTIHAFYPTVEIYYACLSEKKPKMHKPIFISLKNEFAKSADKPAAFLTFSIGADKQIEWTLQQNTQKAKRQSYNVQTGEGKDKLRVAILQANQNKQPLSIRFTFAEGTTFQDYITAQTTIKQVLKEILD